MPIKWGDGLIIGLVLAFALAIALPFYLRPSDQLTCELVQDGETIRTIPLTKDVNERVVVEGACTNVVEVTSAGVCVAESDCPDQVCVRTGTLTRAGQSAVCLPNRLVVRLTGSDQNAVDAVIR